MRLRGYLAKISPSRPGSSSRPLPAPPWRRERIYVEPRGCAKSGAASRACRAAADVTHGHPRCPDRSADSSVQFTSSGCEPTRPSRSRRGDRLHLVVGRARSRTRRSSRPCARGSSIFGNRMCPRCRCQRMTTCAGDLPCVTAAADDLGQLEQRVLALPERPPRLDGDAVVCREGRGRRLLVVPGAARSGRRPARRRSRRAAARGAARGSSRRRSSGHVPTRGSPRAHARSRRTGPAPASASGSGRGRRSRGRAARGSRRTRRTPTACPGRRSRAWS